MKFHVQNNPDIPCPQAEAEGGWEGGCGRLCDLPPPLVAMPLNNLALMMQCFEKLRVYCGRAGAQSRRPGGAPELHPHGKPLKTCHPNPNQTQPQSPYLVINSDCIIILYGTHYS